MLSTVVLLAASMAVGHEGSASAHLKEFQPFIGQWVVHDTLKEDVPLQDEVVKKGAQFVAHTSFRWVVRKNALLFNWSVRLGRTDPIESTQLIVWEKKDKVIRCIWQTTDGEQGTTDWFFEGGALVGKVRGTDDRGVESSSKVHFRLKGKDAYAWRITDRIRDGKPVPDSAEYEYIRIR